MTDSVQYRATYPVALTDDAARRFVVFVYRHLFGWKLALAASVNAALCLLGIVFVGWTPSTIALCALIVLATSYFVVNWFVRPGLSSRMLQRLFGAGATITLREEGFELEVGANKMARAWGRQRAILEYDGYFLLVIAPTLFLVLPRAGMPEQGVAWIRAAMQARAGARKP